MTEDENKDAAEATPSAAPAVILHGAQTAHPANSLSAAGDAIKSSDQSHVGVAARLVDQAIESAEAGLPEAGDQEILEMGDPNAPASDLVVEDDSADDDSSDEDE